jgi:hypothetical protein
LIALVERIEHVKEEIKFIAWINGAGGSRFASACFKTLRRGIGRRGNRMCFGSGSFTSL